MPRIEAVTEAYDVYFANWMLEFQASYRADHGENCPVAKGDPLFYLLQILALKDFIERDLPDFTKQLIKESKQ